MIIEYSLGVQDFLNFQLYLASKSARINKKRGRSWFMIILASILAAIYFYFIEIKVLSIYCFLVAILTFLFYPKYYKRKLKKHYQTHIVENYANRIGEPIEMEFADDFLFAKDKTGESKTKISEINIVNETLHYFFVNMSTGVSFIIPKDILDDKQALKSKFIDLGLSINEELEWKW